MKIGRNEFEITDKDIILDNGACYQLITQTIRRGWSETYPVIAKTLFEKLKRAGAVYTNDELDQLAKSKKYSVGCTYWKFNVDILRTIK
jgi:hypothetical protein